MQGGKSKSMHSETDSTKDSAKGSKEMKAEGHDSKTGTTTGQNREGQTGNMNAQTKGETRDAVETALELLDRGAVRVAEKKDGKWETNQWLKKAVLLSFRLNDSELIPGGGEYPAKTVPLNTDPFSDDQRSVAGRIDHFDLAVGRGGVVGVLEGAAGLGHVTGVSV